jgi:membrane protease YdiL (CAAX protease family)
MFNLRMVDKTLHRILFFPLTRILPGLLVVGGSVALVQWLRGPVFAFPRVTANEKEAILSLLSITAALSSYWLLFRFYEKRNIRELGREGFWKYAGSGLALGFGLQSLSVLLIWGLGDYRVLSVHPVSYLAPGFMAAIVAGFVAELLIRGILFRLLEETLGTLLSLFLFALLFGFLHAGITGATAFSVLAISAQSGILLSAVYIYSRSLWPSIFLHFAWDLAEPGIFGGANPGIKLDQSLLSSRITGSEIWTGGVLGPGASLPAALFCLIASAIFLAMAKKKNRWIHPFWKK